MKRILATCAALFILGAALLTPALADGEGALYPTSITVSEDGTEIRKIYDLSPEADPGRIPRSDFELNGYAYTIVDILRQELPEYEERQHTETVTVNSDSNDMESVLALLPQERESVTEDGLSGTLSLKLDSVRVEVAGYGSSTREVSTTRTYPNLDGQDTSYIPKTVEDNGRTLTLRTIQWETVGNEGSERYTATATYSGTAQSSYVSGYTVTADYTGTVSRVNLNKVRYVAIFSGVPLESAEPDEGASQDEADGQDANTNAPSAPAPEQGNTGETGSIRFPWTAVFLVLGIAAAIAVGAAIAIALRRRSERYYDDDENEEEQK